MGDFRQQMMRKTCHIFGNTISSCTNTGNIKLFNDSNAYVFPKIMKLLNKGLLIDGIKTYTIDSNWGKKNSQYITLSKDKLLLVVNGMFRQYLHCIKKNMSPNDISSVIFSYFEDDDNRYKSSRGTAVWVVSNATQCTDTQPMQYLIEQGVIECLSNLLDSGMTNYLDGNTMIDAMRALDNILLSGKSQGKVNKYRHVFENVGGIGHVCKIIIYFNIIY